MIPRPRPLCRRLLVVAQQDEHEGMSYIVRAGDTVRSIVAMHSMSRAEYEVHMNDRVCGVSGIVFAGFIYRSDNCLFPHGNSAFSVQRCMIIVVSYRWPMLEFKIRFYRMIFELWVSKTLYRLRPWY